MIVTHDAFLARWLRLHPIFDVAEPPRRDSPRPRHDGPVPVEPNRPPNLRDGAAAPLEFDD